MLTVLVDPSFSTIKIDVRLHISCLHKRSAVVGRLIVTSSTLSICENKVRPLPSDVLHSHVRVSPETEHL